MSHKAKVTTVIIILIVLIALGAFWIWYRFFYTQAETIFGCQSTRAISATVGAPGTNLTSYTLFGQTVTVNEIITPFLDNIQKQFTEQKINYAFDDIQTYNSRSKRGGGGLSLHSYGIAIDINPQRNPAQPGKRSQIQYDLPQTLIDLFRKNGFQWGGDWVGNADPMHFEWYGAHLNGSFIDSQSKQKITDGLAITLDGNAAGQANGDYFWTLDSINAHKVSTTVKGYNPMNTMVQLTCFQNQNQNFELTALPDNTPGSVSGKVTLPQNSQILIPATIYLDGKVVESTDITGGFKITDVRQGPHKIEARIMFFPGASKTFNIIKGENITNMNLTIGK